MKHHNSSFLSKVAFWRRSDEHAQNQLELWSGAIEVKGMSLDQPEPDLVAYAGDNMLLTFESKMFTESPEIRAAFHQFSDEAVLDTETLRKLVQMTKRHQGFRSVEHFRPKSTFQKQTDSLRPKPYGATAISILETFRWFCTKDSRDIVDMVLADLKRDVRTMREEGRMGPTLFVESRSILFR